MSALASLERFDEKYLVFLNGRSCRQCLQNEYKWQNSNLLHFITINQWHTSLKLWWVSCPVIEWKKWCGKGFEIFTSKRKFRTQPLMFFWHDESQKERAFAMQVNKLSNLYPSLVSPFDPSVSAGLSSCICLESWLQKSIKCTKVKPPCQLRIIKYMQCTWTAKEEKERENSSRFLCSYLQYFKKKKIGTKLEIILKRLKKSIHSFWHQDCQNTCLLRAYPISGTYVILWHIM